MPDVPPVTLHVRLKPALAGPAAALADQSGMSMPEVLRTGLRSELARRAPVEGQDPYVLGAFGNLAALRAIRDQAIGAALGEEEDGCHANSREALGSAMVAARLTASHGHPDDQRVLAGLFLARGGLARNEGESRLADILDGNSLAFLDAAANGGCEQAEAALLVAAEQVSPGAIPFAAEMAASIREAAR